MLLLGHRGASAARAENTLSAFRSAVEQGADGVELDVMLCASGELVVCHDERLDRVAGLAWEIARTPWWKLQRADVGTALGFGRERMPLLSEVLEAVPRKLLVNIELKCETLDDRGLSVEVGELLYRRGDVERIIVSSFNPLCLARFAAACPAIRRGFLMDPARSLFVQESLLSPWLASYSIHPAESVCTPRRVEAWHRRGFKVVAWTCDDAQRARLLESMGVDLLITNRPGPLRDELG